MESQTDQNLNQAPPVSPVVQASPVSTTEKSKSKLPIIIIGIILFLLVAGSAAGFYVLRQINSKPFLSALANYCTMKNGCPKDKCEIQIGCKEGTGLMPNENCLPEEKCVANGSYPYTSTLLGPTWKTINFENLSFRIPKGWWSKNNEGNISEMQVNPTSLDQPHDWGSGITLKLSKNTSIDDQVNELKRSLAGEQKTFQQYKIKVDGKEAIRVKSVYPNGFIGKDLNHENAYIQVGTDVYSILSDDVRFNSIEEQRVYFQQILSTFKFTDSQSIDTANWKTYINTKVGFEIKYPSLDMLPSYPVGNFGGQPKTVDGTEDSKVIEFPGQDKNYANAFLLELFPYSGTLEKLPELEAKNRLYYAGRNPEKMQKILTVDGLPTIWFRRVDEKRPENYTYEIYYVSKNHAFIFHGAIEEQIDQILSTFKFTDAQTDISNWKTYTNPKYNFSLQYPGDLTLQEATSESSVPSYLAGFLKEGRTDGECIHITLYGDTFTKNVTLENIQNWIKENRKRELPNGEIITPASSQYQNSVNPKLTGYWTVLGAESSMKDIFVKINNKFFELGIHGCAAGDHYTDHPDTEKIAETMISTIRSN